MPGANDGSSPGRPPEPPQARGASGDRDLLAIIYHARRRRRSQRRGGPRLRTIVLATTAVVVFAAAGVAAATVTLIRESMSDCSLAALRPIELGSNSVVFAADGSRLGVIPSARNRQPLALSQISPWLPKATIAVEDRRFYQHGGLDYRGIARAVMANLRAGRVVQGGSTITQELVRNLYIGNPEQTFSRKLKEACLALKLAEAWPRSRILATYLNQVFYGNRAFGAEAAAQTYFSRPAWRLTLGQAALLAGLPQAPSVYNPFRHPTVALDRRNQVLRAMLSSRYISLRQYDRAAGAPLGLHRGHVYQLIRQPNFFGYVQQQLVGRYGAKRVQGGGLRVRTTLEPWLQRAAHDAIASVLRSPDDPASALVAIDPRTGAVRAMTSFLPDGERMQFDLASQGHRQAGSAFKPFLLAAAVKRGISLYSTFSGPPGLVIPDERCDTNNEHWEVHNYADERAGTMNLLDATAHSVNTIFAQLVVAVSPRSVVRTAHQLGITSRLRSVCSITLGTQAVSPLEMTAGYATFAARGIRHRPQVLKVVRGPGGAVLGRLDPRGVQALAANSADLVTYALRGVMERGTGTAAAIGRPAAGKTGTAESFQDAWFCGYVPQLATCVWIGYPHREKPLYWVEGYAAVFGGSLPAAIWQRFMSVAVADLPVEDFPTPTVSGYTITPPPVQYPTYGTTTEYGTP